MKTMITIELPSGQKLELDKKDLAHLRKELKALEDSEAKSEMDRWKDMAEKLNRKNDRPYYVPVPIPQPIPYYGPRFPGEIWCQTRGIEQQ